MSTAYLDALRPVSETITTQEGGQAFAIDDWARLQRFLILGSESGTFYVGARDLTLDNAEVVKRCLDADWRKTIDDIVAISDSGRAPKNESAILALAIAASHPEIGARHYALLQMPRVCRTGTHLLHFMAYCKQLRKSSRMYRTAIGNWFNEMDVDKLAYQAVKYKQRDGWSMADALRIARPTAVDEQHNAIYKYIVDGQINEFAPGLLTTVNLLRDGNIADIPATIREFRVPREAVPTDLLNDPNIWDALLQDMPMTAMIRNLAKMTAVGLIANGSKAVEQIVMSLGNQDRIRKARVHPIALLNALRVYEQGHGDRGSLRWTANKKIVTALDEAFYLAFGNVPTTGKRIMLGLDVSSSMDVSKIAGTSLTARDACAAMALVTSAVEPNVEMTAYSTQLVSVAIRPSSRLDQVIREMRHISFGGTDCSLPIRYALETGKRFDAFVSYTDSETGRQWNYPHILREYRTRFVKNARSVVVGATATNVSLNDPLDRYGLDIAGFDTATPGIISDFIAGTV